MDRYIKVEIVCKGMRFSRTVCTNVKSMLSEFMRDVNAAAIELREDIDKEDNTDQEELLDAALDLCNGMSTVDLSPLDQGMVRKLDKISKKINDGG